VGESKPIEKVLIFKPEDEKMENKYRSKGTTNWKTKKLSRKFLRTVQITGLWYKGMMTYQRIDVATREELWVCAVYVDSFQCHLFLVTQVNEECVGLSEN
jgi:hypothetical protein